MRFVISRPAVFIETEGAVRNPWRENVPLRSLQGRRSARVVRAFPGLPTSVRHTGTGHAVRQCAGVNLQGGGAPGAGRHHRAGGSQGSDHFR